MTGVRELTFLMGRGLGTGTGHKSLNPSFLDSGCKTITLINLTTCKALASLADCIGRPLLQPPSEVLTIYSVLIGGVRGWARSPCFGEGRRGKEEEADGHLIAIEDTGIDPQAGQNRHTLSPGLDPAQGGSKAGKSLGQGTLCSNSTEPGLYFLLTYCLSQPPGHTHRGGLGRPLPGFHKHRFCLLSFPSEVESGQPAPAAGLTTGSQSPAHYKVPAARSSRPECQSLFCMHCPHPCRPALF